MQRCIFDFVHLHEQSSSFYLSCNDWICTATRVYKPDGFNPSCHDYAHIMYAYIPPLLHLPYVCIFYVYAIMTNKNKNYEKIPKRHIFNII